MQDNKQKAAARQFIERWQGRGYEKGESQSFWIDLLQSVLGIVQPTEFISFENQVKLASTSFIDAYIPTTKVLIEQKSIEKDLRKPIKQSDGTLLTPFQQAKRYAAELPYSKRPRWVVVSNFQSFLIYDMENPQGEPEEILLRDLEREVHRLRFLVDAGNEHIKHEMEVSIKAGELVGLLYDAFLAQYGGQATSADLHALNVLCVRLVFCLYAEDAGVFQKDQFHDYLATFKPENMRMALKQLFQVLDTPTAQRDRFLEDKLRAFPYVNGSLFRQQPGEDIPPLTEATATLLLDKASIDFDWSEISPTIFGAVFESTLNPETRRSGGMHYTSIENIHRVIDPLFMDELREEFERISEQPHGKARTQQLEQFQQQLASLRFLDPACGSGNFLTETYVSLRRLENRVIEQLLGGQSLLGFEEVNPIRVNIHQFYGIEINDFAVTVATTALWIAEAQMMNETERIIQFTNDYLPLKTYTNIHEGNALRIAWEDVVNPQELDYIIGNPPFVGARMMNKEQKDDALEIFGKKWKNVGNLDYVACWYKKATELMRLAFENGKVIRTALVSTNSITQGEQVANLWKPLMETDGVHIDFAWRTFRWDSESTLKAHVHCVIVGFSVAPNSSNRKLFFSEENCKEVENINGYLIDAGNIFVESRSKSICESPELMFGNMPNDGGHLSDYSTEDKNTIVSKYAEAGLLFRKFMGATEFLNKKERWCLWLKGISPSAYRSITPVMDALQKVRELRAASNRPGTKKMADYPMLFGEIRQTDNSYLLVPRHSSENRRYVPLGYLSAEYICGDSNMMIPDATLYHFGILTSNVHMAWMRAVCGRLEMRYRYSKDIVYNNFPWPTPTEEQKARIEQTAQAILDARALYPDSSLADLYDEVTMPAELRRAHQQNDRAVMQAYGFPIKDFTESDCVARLLEMYQELAK